MQEKDLVNDKLKKEIEDKLKHEMEAKRTDSLLV
jgi:hypothetical protein